MKKKILIIEDDMQGQRILRTRLEALGYKIEVANDGEEGIEKALSTRPDLVITDILLPKKDGYEVCATLKSDPEFKGVPIIMLSAIYITEVDRDKGISMGADQYFRKPDIFINKPFRADELLEHIKILLGEKKVREKREIVDRILVIHENRKIERLLKLRLSEEGYEVLTAETGEEGIDLCHIEDPAAVILSTDVNDGGGIDVLARLGEEKPETPVIVMSSNGSEKTVVQAFQAGAIDYLTPPLDYDGLPEIIKRCIEKNKVRISQGKMPKQMKRTILDLLERNNKMEKKNKELMEEYNRLANIKEPMDYKEREVKVVEVAGNVAHKLNRLMTEMLSQLELIAGNISEKDPDYQIMRLIKENCRRITEEVNYLGDVAQYEIKPFIGGREYSDDEKEEKG